MSTSLTDRDHCTKFDIPPNSQMPYFCTEAIIQNPDIYPTQCVMTTRTQHTRHARTHSSQYTSIGIAIIEDHYQIDCQIDIQ